MLSSVRNSGRWWAARPIISFCKNLPWAARHSRSAPAGPPELVRTTTYRCCSVVDVGNLGVVDVNQLDAAVQALITGPLAATVNVGTFPIFLTKDMVSSNGDTNLFGGNCCILGYHSGFNVGPNIQIYSPFSLDTTGLFGGDVGTCRTTVGSLIAETTRHTTGEMRDSARGSALRPMSSPSRRTASRTRRIALSAMASHGASSP
ncbi:hypothetical protein SBA3_220005 [Candidatus Sulfopaludibacter sp. SbA3]|nr:hypothetical protein SBA3_220005 [Candidatus Sulfopaludibacter sp. SbA3]